MYACPAKNILEKGLLVPPIISRNNEIRQNEFKFGSLASKNGRVKKLFGLNYRTDEKRYVDAL